ncbi:MAG: 2-amino-4-hydroxy-6-hydroxymethyldihydropteridine diphosphokinase [Candidatus Fraserbacteria bacterium RBG_16_55_9]|uniref:2-amino-4-hydroxy-6-hydroxymethyldihydropteridine diphosphokinase n=1 Tax=Fraserbacteria sp. (strain RBG_16_55_9) TaxID=1817864 RepID=A0A1F5V2R9_FRAXR|nr:MAG: 2-amino-4-hydroxy-6-hydroxymethyldihydropteridine diphosphokinase [Candidatus Fraserbacteria bacterium RBG_16_55_9]
MLAGERVFIGLGSNLSHRQEFIERAIALLAETQSTELIRRASLYETEPVGYEDQPWFLNTVIEVRTRLPPQELLVRLKEIESRLGRRGEERWRPRQIDLDLLLYGNRIMNESTITIPHTGMHTRRFVLTPLAEIAPDVVHPVCGKTIMDLLRALDDQKGVQLSRRSRMSERT